MILVAAAVVTVLAWIPTQQRMCNRFDGVKARVAVTAEEWAAACVDWSTPFGTPHYIRNPRPISPGHGAGR